jgi:hypothetical protein
MKLFIWRHVENLTNNYHEAGGCVVIGKDLEDARMFLIRTEEWLHENCQVLTDDPDEVYTLEDNVLQASYIFPDAGCC